MMKPSELNLPYQEFKDLVQSRYLDGFEREWLSAWEKFDFARSPTKDDERRLLRQGHYSGYVDAYMTLGGNLHEGKGL